MYVAVDYPLWLDRLSDICSVVELLFMGVSSVFQQTFSFIDVKIYYKKQLDYKHKYYSKGWHLPII